MKYDADFYFSPMLNEESEQPNMPAQLSLNWNESAVTSFLHKLSTVNREGIIFPQFSNTTLPSPQGTKCFEFELLKYLSCDICGVTVYGEYSPCTVVVKGDLALCKLVARLIALPSEPWVQAVLQHGEPTKNKLLKLKVFMRGEPHDFIDFEDELIH